MPFLHYFYLYFFPLSDRIHWETKLLCHSNKSHHLPHKSDPWRSHNCSQKCQQLGWSHNHHTFAWCLPCWCICWQIPHDLAFLHCLSHGIYITSSLINQLQFKYQITWSVMYMYWWLQGLGILTMSQFIPSLKPSKGKVHEVVFFAGIYLLSLGSGGHKPSLESFGADQFDDDNLEERKGNMFFSFQTQDTTKNLSQHLLRRR